MFFKLIYLQGLVTFFLFYRYNQGVTDIQATSIKIIGEPQEVFTEIRRGTVGTKYVQYCIYA